MAELKFMLAHAMAEEHARSLLVFVVVVGVLGGLVMLALMMTWRRRLAREQALHEKQKLQRGQSNELTDTWKASADRVTIEQAPPTPLTDEQPDDVFEDISSDDVIDGDDPAPPPMEDYLPELREHESDDDAGLDESFFSEEDQPYDPPPQSSEKDSGDSSKDDEDSTGNDDYDDPFGRRDR